MVHGYTFIPEKERRGLGGCGEYFPLVKLEGSGNRRGAGIAPVQILHGLWEECGLGGVGFSGIGVVFLFMFV